MMPASPSPDPDNLTFYLIDLHRAQIREKTPDRWRLKDLSGLYFSAMDCGLTQRDIFRFIKAYSNLPLRDALQKYHTLLSRIESKAVKLYKRMERKADSTG
jgi:heptose I phosphotransferase